MPIYAYRCSACGFAKDVLQKMSDAPLSVCPECHEPSFTKQVTAAGFQIKGSGWYVTDFRNNNSGGTTSSGGTPAASGASDASPSAAVPAASATPSTKPASCSTSAA